MYGFLPSVQKKYTSWFSFFVKILHEKLFLTPNQISIVAFFLSLFSALFIIRENLVISFIFLFFSLFLDALDGTVARKYKLESPMGKKLEIIFDRSAELILFLSLWLVGYVDLYLIIIAFLSIALMTFLCFFTAVDFGGKRIMIFLGPLVSFSVAFFLIIIVQFLSIIISLFKIVNKNVIRN